MSNIDTCLCLLIANNLFTPSSFAEGESQQDLHKQATGHFTKAVRHVGYIFRKKETRHKTNAMFYNKSHNKESWSLQDQETSPVGPPFLTWLRLTLQVL